MRHNVSTPGGFFVGLGGIIAFCVVSSLVYLWVKNPAPNQEFREQQAALGLAAAPDAPRDEVKKKRAETDALLEAAAAKYNGGTKPDIDRLADLRGVVRFREARKAEEASVKALSAASSAQGKTVIAAAIEEVAKEIGTKKVAPSSMALAEVVPNDPKAAPSLPNAMGGGVHTMQFVKPLQPKAAPAPAPAPGAPPAPAGQSTPPAAPAAAPAPQGAPGAPGAAPAPTNPTPPPAAAPAPAARPANASTGASAPVAIAAPNRPPLLNWSATK